jgi:hypothetical protein
VYCEGTGFRRHGLGRPCYDGSVVNPTGARLHEDLLAGEIGRGTV